MVKMAVGAGTDSNANPGLKRRAKPASGVAPAMLAAPALSGPALVSAALRVDPGIWGGVPAPAVTPRWRRNGVEIAGAVGVEYTPVAADDGTDLDCVVTASNASGTVEAATGTVRVVYPAPVAAGALADLVLDQGPGARTLDASGAFAGAALVFGVSGAGASVDPATGLVSIPLGDARAAETVTVTAANSGGSASVAFAVTIVAAPVLTPPVSTVAPSLSGLGRVGTPMLVDMGVWGGVPAPAVTSRWRRNGVDISGAAGVEYTPVAADDGADLDCVVTASNASGTASAATGTVRIAYPVPAVAGALADLVLDQGQGARTLDASGAFAGASLAFDVAGAGASVDPATGLVSIPLDDARAAETVTVTATNSGGSALVSFAVTVVAADVTAPVLTIGAIDVATSPATLSVTTDEGGTAFWIVDGAATRGAAEVEAGGGVARGSFVVGAGSNAGDVNLDSVAPGAWTLHLVIRDPAGNPSNVISTAFTLAAVAPPESIDAPAVSGGAVAGSVLSGTDGLWTGDDLSYGRVWERGGVVIPGETGPTYTTTASDVGSTITRTVTASNNVGSASATSAPVGPIVAAGPATFTLSPTGPYFVDPANVPAETTRIEMEARIRLASLPTSGFASVFEQESTGLRLLLLNTGLWSVYAEDGDGTPIIASLTHSDTGPTAGVWFTVRIDVNMETATFDVYMDGALLQSFPFIDIPAPATFQRSREISFFANSAGGNPLASGGVGSVNVEYARAWFTTGGVRTLRKEISGSATTVNADAWLRGGLAT